MADIQAFRGLRYDLTRVGKLSDVVAPPYDVIDAQQQDVLYRRNPCNIVRLELNRAEPGDGRDDSYRRAAHLLKIWKREGIIQTETRPAIYIYHQTFEHEGVVRTRRGFVCRLRLEPFGQGKVYPHEETHARAKQDRLALTQQTRCNLSPIFGLYQDEANDVQQLLESKIADSTPLEAVDDLGVSHKIWMVHDLPAIANAARLMGDKSIFIADGHHRYETGCNYIQFLESSGGPLFVDHPARYIMIACFSMSDPGLVVLPTHRVFRGVPPIDKNELWAKLAPAFDCVEKGNGPEFASQLWDEIELEGNQSTLGFYSAKDQTWSLARLTLAGSQLMNQQSKQSPEWNSLGVSLLHTLAIQKLLGLTSLPSPLYVRKIEDVVQALTIGDSAGRDATGQLGSGKQFELASLVLPATVEHVRQISLNGERMPAKSTYFFPKLLTGLVLNPLEA